MKIPQADSIDEQFCYLRTKEAIPPTTKDFYFEVELVHFPGSKYVALFDTSDFILRVVSTNMLTQNETPERLLSASAIPRLRKTGSLDGTRDLGRTILTTEVYIVEQPGL